MNNREYFSLLSLGHYAYAEERARAGDAGHFSADHGAPSVNVSWTRDRANGATGHLPEQEEHYVEKSVRMNAMLVGSDVALVHVICRRARQPTVATHVDASVKARANVAHALMAAQTGGALELRATPHTLAQPDSLLHRPLKHLVARPAQLCLELLARHLWTQAQMRCRRAHLGLHH